MIRICFAEQYFYPEGWGGAEIPRDVTTYLAERGYSVSVVCGADPYVPVKGDPGPDPRLSGIVIRRVPRLFAGTAHKRKLLRQLWFYLIAFPMLVLQRSPGLFVVQTNPPMIVLLASLAAWLHRRPLLIIAQDLYPEALAAHGLMRPDSVGYRVLRWVLNSAYRSAAMVIALGPAMSERLVQKGVHPSAIRLISNWATGDLAVNRSGDNRFRSEWGLAGHVVALYSGNVGIGHEFETLLDGLACAVAEQPNLCLVFVGQGSRLDEVKRGVTARGLEKWVHFKDLVPASELPDSLGIADLAIVTLRPRFEGLIVPSKTLGYLARGIPVLYIGPWSDVDWMLGEGECGVTVRTGNTGKAAACLIAACQDPETLSALGERGRRKYTREFAREVALRRYEDAVRECVSGHRRARSDLR